MRGKAYRCGTKHIAPEAIGTMAFINKGNVAEQYVAQHLIYAGRVNCAPELFYWLREGRKGNAEVDFLAADAQGVLPIEVKAGQSGALKSLHQFVLRQKASRAVRFDMNKPSRQTVACSADRGNGIAAVEFTLTSLPLYMVHRSDLW